MLSNPQVSGQLNAFLHFGTWRPPRNDDLHITPGQPVTSGPATYRNRCMPILGRSRTPLDSAPQGGWHDRKPSETTPVSNPFRIDMGVVPSVLKESINLLILLRGPTSRSIAVQMC